MTFTASLLPSGWTVTPTATNDSLTATVTRTGENNTFDFIELSYDINAELKPESRLLSGIHRFGEILKREEVKNIMKTDIAGGWIMLRLDEGNYIMCGIASWRIFQAEVILRGGKLVIRYCGSGKRFAENQTIKLEDVYIARATSEQEALDNYADYIVKNLNIKLNTKVWRGWGDWDYYTSFTSEEAVLDNLRNTKALHDKVNLLQIDDGYPTAIGDWMDIDLKKFPRGLKPVIDEAAAMGVETGLWMAPFQGHLDSKLLRDHPEWFERAADGSVRQYGIAPVCILDYSQDEVCEYIKECVRHFRSLGVTYFKLDFLLAGSDTYGSAKNPMTPYERTHRCLSAFREAAGPDAYILSGSSNYGPCLGYIDAQRVGPDIGPSWNGVRFAAKSGLATIPFHRKLFQCDPDFIVVRGEGMTDDACTSPGKQARLTQKEAQFWADFVSMTGEVYLCADKMSLLTDERKKLISDTLNNYREIKSIRIADYWRGDNQDSPAIIVSDNRLGVFNFDDTERTYTLPDGTERTLEGRTSLIIDNYNWDGKQLTGIEKPLDFVSPLGEDFADGDKTIALPLGKAAQYRLAYDFDYGSQVMDDVYSSLAGTKKLLGVNLDVGENALIISDKSEGPIEIEVGRTASAIYILHAAAYPTSKPWVDYTAIYQDGTEQTFTAVVCEDIGNIDYIYTPINGKGNGRLAWHNTSFTKAAYLMEINLGSSKEVKALRVSKPLPHAQATHVLLAAATRP